LISLARASKIHGVCSKSFVLLKEFNAFCQKVLILLAKTSKINDL